jgi:membrane-bound serine protease (ClpP class)
MTPLTWAALLLLLGLLFVVLEVLIPSAGMLGILAAFSVLGSIVMAFRSGLVAGGVFVLLTVVIVPIAVSVAVRVWPYTPMGKRLLLTAPTGEELKPDSEQLRMLKSLVGQVGQARSVMLPAGAVEIGDQTVNAQSSGLPIEAGQWVRVVDVRGSCVIVRALTPEERSQSAPASPKNELDRPAEIDPFEEPPA